MSNIKFNYDSEHDVLYISIVPNKPAIGEEDDYGNVIRRCRKTNQIVGITIFDFKQKLKENKFKQFLKDNKDKIDKIAEKNTIRNELGQTVISKDDEWREDNEWNNHYDDNIIKKLYLKYNYKQIGNLITKKRNELDYSKEQLANEWKISVKLLDIIEEGRRVLNLNLYKLISEFLDIPLEELLKIMKKE